jgi:hypothetical protein
MITSSSRAGAVVADAAAVQELGRAEVFAGAGSSPRGLSSAEAATRLAEQGPNELPHPRGR